MKPTIAVFVDSLDRRAAEVSGKLGRWVKEHKVPADLPQDAHDAFQEVRNSSSQITPNVHQALTGPTGDAAVLALAALDASIDAMHTLIGALPTDTRAFSAVDDLMSLRDDVEARFSEARQRLTAVSGHGADEMTGAGTGAHRFSI
jgi:predicted metalloendopeptidase